MARLKRTKKLRKGDAVYIPERSNPNTQLELYANNIAYKGDQVCVGILVGADPQYIIQTTIRELEDAIIAFKKLRGIKRVSNKSK